MIRLQLFGGVYIVLQAMIDPQREAVPLGQTDTPGGCMTGARRRETELEEKWSIFKPWITFGHQFHFRITPVIGPQSSRSVIPS